MLAQVFNAVRTTLRTLILQQRWLYTTLNFKQQTVYTVDAEALLQPIVTMIECFSGRQHRSSRRARRMRETQLIELRGWSSTSNRRGADVIKRGGGLRRMCGMWR